LADDSGHSGAVEFFLSVILICFFIYKCLNFAPLSNDLLHVFMYCDFVLHAVHGTETYFQLSQHLLLDQSPYSGIMKLMVCML
jgi:hypothetical protein